MGSLCSCNAEVPDSQREAAAADYDRSFSTHVLVEQHSELGSPRRGSDGQILKFFPGATGVEERDEGVGPRQMRWHFDGAHFRWQCLDEGVWIPVLCKLDFTNMLRAMHERGTDDREWTHVRQEMRRGGSSREPQRRIEVWVRDPVVNTGGVKEFKVECDVVDSEPELLFDLLNEHAYRATWDATMVRGFNIARFARNNDIGYYEARAPMPLSNRDFCNQRGWLSLGGRSYIIGNRSHAHPLMPHRSGIVRAWSYLTAYVIVPCKRGGPGSTLIYMTCTDPAGSIPKRIVNHFTTSNVPDGCIKLATAALGLQAWREEVWRRSNQGQHPVPGPWDKTCRPTDPRCGDARQMQHGYVPLDPSGPKPWHVAETSLDAEAHQVATLCEIESRERLRLAADNLSGLRCIAEETPLEGMVELCAVLSRDASPRTPGRGLARFTASLVPIVRQRLRSSRTPTPTPRPSPAFTPPAGSPVMATSPS